jgi:hypothetical protein
MPGTRRSASSASVCVSAFDAGSNFADGANPDFVTVQMI